MKTLLIFTGLFFITSHTYGQLKRTELCPPISVDILYGKVNGLEISSTIGQVKAKLPCFTSAEDENKTAKCGGGVFYRDKDIYFYTGRDYVEIREKFKGKLSIPLMGASRNSLFKWLGNAKIKDVNWDAYTTAYGILILYFNKANKINKIQFSNQSELTLNLCE